jgi:hypothetical protein
MRPRLSPRVAAALISVVALGCVDLSTQPETSAGPAPRFDVAEVPATESTVQLLACPTHEVQSARAVIGPDGGGVAVRGVSIAIPAGAVSEPTEFEVTVPASPYLEVEIHAVGYDTFQFQQPATITIKYSSCSDNSVTASARFVGAYIDTETNQVLEVLGGVDDKAARRVSFTTWHLSGYAVAY